MYAKIANAAFEQQRADRIWHAANADLQAGTILDLGGDATGHCGIDFGRLWIGQFRRRIVVAFDDVIDLAYVNPVLVSIDIGQASAHLDDDHPGAFNHRAVPDVGRTEIEVAILIQWACL